MAFTPNNDLNILQASDTSVVSAAAGDDLYIIDGSSTGATQTITISDTEGSNIIKIVGGVTIASSIIAATVAQLTLSNGTIININGADTFTFEIGGAFTTAGTGTSQDFATFAAQTLGVATLPTGTDTVTGNTNVTTNTDGTVTGGGSSSTTETFSLAAAGTGVDEGNTATFTLTTTNVTDGASVPYTLTGVDAADVTGGALTGTATVTNNTATITVNLAADAATEGAETLTLTLDGKTTSATMTVNDTSTAISETFTLTAAATGADEGTTATFNLVTTNVADGTSVAYTLTGIDAADLSSGSLTGTATVTGGVATISVALAADTTTESAETLTVSIDGQSATASTTVNDTSLTSSAFILTAAADTPTLTSSDDTIDGTTNVDSLNGDDSIVDASTTDNDTLNAKLTAPVDKSDGTASDQPTITNIENIVFDWDRVGNATIDTKNISGANTITLNSSNSDFLGGLTFDNTGANKVVAGTSVTNITVNDATTGSADVGSSSSAKISGTISTTDAPSLILNGDITLENDDTAGTIVESLTLSATVASVVTLSGDAITTGGINSSLILTGDKDITILADDTLTNLVGFIGKTITDSMTGGTSTLEIQEGGVAAVDLSKAAVDLINLNVDETGTTFTFKDGANVQFSKNQTNTVTVQSETPTSSISLATTSDVSSINQLNTTVSLLESVLFTVGGNLTIGTLTDETSLFKIKGTGDITINSNAASATSNINASELVGKLTLTANADLDNAVTVKGGSGANSIATGVMAVGNKFTYTGKDGGDTISTDTVASTISVTTGSGNDTFTSTVSLAAGKYEFTSGAGDDVLKLTNTDVAVSVSILTFDGGAGTDSLDMTLAAAAVVNLADDTLTLTSVEKLVLSAGATKGDSFDVLKGALVLSAEQISGKSYIITGNASVDDVVTVVGTASADTIDLSSLVPDENVQGFYVSGSTGQDTITASSIQDVITVAAQTTTAGIDVINGFKGGTDILATGITPTTAVLIDLRTTDFSSASTVAGAAVLAVAASEAATTGNYATAGDALLFSFSSKTYLSINDAGNTTFVDGADILLELSGLTGTLVIGDLIAA